MQRTDRVFSGARARPASTSAFETTPAEQFGDTRAVIAFSVFTAIFTIGVTPYISLLPEISKNAFGQSATGYGERAAAGGVGAMSAAVVLAWRGDMAHKGRLAIVVAFAGSALLVAFTQTRAILPAMALLVAMGAVDTLMFTLGNTYVQQISGNAGRGRANAIFALAFLGDIPVGNAGLGLLAGRFGSQPVLGWSASLVAVAAIVFWFAAPLARDAA